MKRSPILLFAAPLLVLALGYVLYQWTRGDSPLPMRDFVEYWSAGRAFLDDRNPYDPQVLVELQRSALADSTVDQPVMMWNPPWALALVGPFGALSPPTSHLLWLASQFAAVLASIAMLLRVYRVPKEVWIVGFAVGLVFCPFFLLLWYGQIGGLLALGLAGFLFCIQRDRPFAAGAFAALTALKPHLLFAFGLALLLDAAICARGRRMLAGGAVALAAAALAVWLYNPMVYGHYFESIRAPSSDAHRSVRDWYQPLAGYWLRRAIDPSQFWIQFVLTLNASLLIVVLWIRRPRPIDWPVQLPRLILVSVLCAAYGAWVFDLVVLLIPILQAAAWLARAENRNASFALGGGYALFNLLCSTAPIFMVILAGKGVGIHTYIFFAPAILAFYLLAGRLAKGTPP